MASSPKERVPELFRERGLDFGREDLAEMRSLFVRLPDPVEAHEARQGAYEALWLIVADPQYRGDLTMADLGHGPTREDAADELLARFLG